MNEHDATNRGLRAMLLAAVALAVMSLVTVAVVRLAGMPTLKVTPSPATAERQLLFFDRSDGGIEIVDAATQQAIVRLPPGGDGFIRATLRTFAQERRRRGIGASEPFHLVAHADGRLSLTDPSTGRRVDLEAFGPTNAAAFARLLAPRAPERQARLGE
jgi:putative photosynthetic complex assembly protein